MTDKKRKAEAQVLAWIEEALEPVRERHEELLSQIKALEAEMGVGEPTVEMVEKRVEDFVRQHPEVDFEKALDFVMSEVDQEQAARRRREEEHRQEKASAFSDLLDKKAAGMSHEEAIELVERVDQGEVL